jgi:hypothetical protein
MNIDVRSLHEELKREWCDLFNVDLRPDGTITITSPFMFGDGDAYPILLRRTRDGWILTDQGMATSHLRFGDFDVTETHTRQIERFATEYGYTYESSTLVRAFDSAPDLDDVSEIIKLMVLIDGMPLHVQADRESEQFRTRATRRIVSQLPDPSVAVEMWQPPRQDGELFPADLWLPSAEHHDGVVSFFAATTQRADRALSFAAEYARWDLGVKSVLIHPGTLNDRTIHRAAVVLEDESAVVRVEEAATETGFMRAVVTLRRAGVSLD